MSQSISISNPKLIKALNVYAGGSAAINALNQAKDFWRSRYWYTLKIDSKDSIYEDVHAWITARLPTDSKNSVVKSGEVKVGDDYETQLKVLHDDQRVVHLVLDGHKINVYIVEGNGSIDMQKGIITPPENSITFSSPNVAGRDVVVKHLNAIVDKYNKGERKPALHMLARWGDWTLRNDLPSRTMESVVLRQGQAEFLINDIATFLSQEVEYIRRGIPWHRGYLFHGPPGTGKTSTAKALAHHFGIDLYYAPLGDIENDTSLLKIINNVRSRSILLLEDIDIFAAATERSKDDKQASLSGLLNSLDGVATPHGLIYILTSNDPDELDEALTRTGRIDHMIEMSEPDDEQLNRLFTVFYGQSPPEELKAGELSASDVMEVFKTNMFDPQEAFLQLRK